MLAEPPFWWQKQPHRNPKPLFGIFPFNLVAIHLRTGFRSPCVFVLHWLSAISASSGCCCAPSFWGVLLKLLHLSCWWLGGLLHVLRHVSGAVACGCRPWDGERQKTPLSKTTVLSALIFFIFINKSMKLLLCVLK